MEIQNENCFISDCYKNERIIIGLTGKTGSGCTKVARIIKSLENNREVSRAPSSDGEDDLQRRSWAIVYDYFRGECQLQVHVIKAVDAINKLLFGDAENYKALKTHIENIRASNTETTRRSLIDTLEREISPLFTPSKDLSRDLLQDAGKKLRDLLRQHVVNFRVTPNRPGRRKQANLYTYIYQELGNTIRATGKASLPSDPAEFEPHYDQRTLETLALKIEGHVPKEPHNGDRATNLSTIIVIDSIRNPFEAMYFSKKYSNFYLLAVNRSDQERLRSLRQKGLKIEDIEDLDDQEYPSEEINKESYYKINIRKCEEMADIYLVNDPSAQNGDRDSLKRQVIRYLALMLKPGLVNPTKIEACMQVANTVKLNSGCLSRQVGAVVTDKDHKILSVGWNTAPGSQIPCNLRNAHDLIARRDRDAFSHYENESLDFRNYFTLKLQHLDRQSQGQKDPRADGNGTHEFFPYCFRDVYNAFKKDKNQIHTRSIHAEEMALLNETLDCDDGVLFTTSSPCELCAKKAYQKEIRRVYYLIPYKGIANEHILKGGASKLSMEMFYGATGKAYAKLYTPWMSHKDEYYMKKGFKFSDGFEGIKIKAESDGRAAKYLCVKEVGEGSAKYSIGLSNRESSSGFSIIEDDQKIVIRYKIKTNPPDRRNWKNGPCPLCGTEAQENAAETPMVCHTCGFPKSMDSDDGGAKVAGKPPELPVYLCADLNDNKGTLKANRVHRYTWEMFKIKFVDKRRFCLQAMANDKFVRVGSDDRLIADVEDEDPSPASCLFEIEFPRHEH